LKELFPGRGGYARPEDGEKVEIVWQRGENPRFELFDKATGKIAKVVMLSGLKIRGIEQLLEEYGFFPVKGTR